MADKIKVIIKRPDEGGHVAWISNSLENLQRTVEGYIETVTCGEVVIICNEGGRLRGLEPNCTIAGTGFVGTIIVAGINEDDGEFCDIPEWFTLKFFKEEVKPYVPLSAMWQRI